MYKESRWAEKIINLQKQDGSWGYFHTLSEPGKNPVTTEQALRRLEILGFSINDECIQKAVMYMHDCLTGEKALPDRREKLHDWDIFTQLMLAAWIRRFTENDDKANHIADIWTLIISSAFKSGKYSQEDYLTAYRNVFSQEARGGRLVDFVSFYQVSLISDRLDLNTEGLVFDYIMKHSSGVYYIGYNRQACSLPNEFCSKNASRFLATIELMSLYKHNLKKLQFVLDWLHSNRNQEGKWDMGSSSKDFIHFPLSNSWRNKQARIDDCTYRIEKLINIISANGAAANVIG